MVEAAHPADPRQQRRIGTAHDRSTQLDDGYQEWSPDSTQIAFVGRTDTDGSGTYVYDLATGETRFVSSGTIESWIDNDHILVS